MTLSSEGKGVEDDGVGEAVAVGRSADLGPEPFGSTRRNLYGACELCDSSSQRRQD